MTTVNITFSYTHKDENVEYSGGIVIDYNGSIQGSGSNIVIRGGYSTDRAAKLKTYDKGFYLTDAQRISLSQILRKLAKTNDRLEIKSDNGALQEISYAIYRNYC